MYTCKTMKQELCYSNVPFNQSNNSYLYMNIFLKVVFSDILYYLSVISLYMPNIKESLILSTLVLIVIMNYIPVVNYSQTEH